MQAGGSGSNLRNPISLIGGWIFVHCTSGDAGTDSDAKGISGYITVVQIKRGSVTRDERLSRRLTLELLKLTFKDLVFSR